MYDQDEAAAGGERGEVQAGQKEEVCLSISPRCLRCSGYIQAVAAAKAAQEADKVAQKELRAAKTGAVRPFFILGEFAR